MASYCYGLSNWYGIKDVYYIDRGDWSDPLIAYKENIYNYWDVEDYCFDELSEEEIKEKLKDSSLMKCLITELTPCGKFKIVNNPLCEGKLIEYIEEEA